MVALLLVLTAIGAWVGWDDISVDQRPVAVNFAAMSCYEGLYITVCR
jgi:hypothetical protein